MKKILLISFIIFSCVSLVSAGTTIKGLLGYGFKLAPSFSDFSAYSDVEESNGGLNLAAQVLFGEDELLFGGEVGYLSVYSYSYKYSVITGYNILGTQEMEFGISAIPILGIIQYNLGDSNEGFRPYLQGGLGFYLTSVTASLLGVSASSSELHLGIKLAAGGAVEMSSDMDFDFSVNFYNIFIGGGAATLNIEAGIAYKL